MPVVTCDIADCAYVTGDVGDAVGAVKLSRHYADAHPVAAPVKAPPLPQPKLASRVHEDMWDVFERDWKAFKDASSIAPNKINIYLLSCCDSELKANVQKELPDVVTKTEDEVLQAIKRHAVIVVASSVLQTELLAMKQDHDEPIRQFASRALGKARNCRLTEDCPRKECASQVDFSSKMVKLVLLTGLCDEEIKKEVLGTEDLDNKTLNETIAIIEVKETAARSLGSFGQAGQAASSTSYKKLSAADKKKGPCKECGTVFQNCRVRELEGKEDIVQTLDFCPPCWKKKRDEEEMNSYASTLII